MELEYVYTKLRSEFGHQCAFSDTPVDMIDHCYPNAKQQREYLFRNPVNQSSQCCDIFAEHYVNTESKKHVNSSMNHSEGGWPKDMNLNDEEQPKRYRRKIEREDNYITAVTRLASGVENFIVQNTSINIYKHYYTGLEPARLVDRNFVRTVNVYVDQAPVKRPITHISWSPSTHDKLAISYCDLTFQAPKRRMRHRNSYIWEVENPNMPLFIIKPPVQIVCLEYHMKDVNCLAGGMINGQISLWDTRKGHEMVECTVTEESHRDPVRDLKWVSSKTGSEFYTGSSDGQLKWWDIRKLSAPTETLIIDVVRFGEDQMLPRAMGVSCLEYEPTIPTRFMVGTEHGYVVNGNRKGKNHLEKLVSKAYATNGPIYALERNSALTKIFMTVGDSRCHIWSEECRDSPIISTNSYPTELTGGAWSPTRYSVFYLIRYDGVMDLWDILQNQHEPMINCKLSDDSLTAIRVHELGQMAMVGSQNGTTYLVQMSDNFTTNLPHERILIGAMFDRETLGEKVLEGKLRELRLKSRMQTKWKENEIDMKSRLKMAEKEFYQTIEDEINPPSPETSTNEGEPDNEPEEQPPPPPPPPPPPKLLYKKSKVKKGKKKIESIAYNLRTCMKK